MRSVIPVVCAVVLLAISAQGQSLDPNAPLPFARPQGPVAPPTLISLDDALDRARKIDLSVQSALADAAIAREDLVQARASRLPSLSHNSDYIGTQGNGATPNGRFVSSDGVHEYRSVATVKQELSPNTFLKTDYQRANAARALAEARVDIARRGLEITVAESYYALVSAQRRYGSSQQGVQTAQRFLDVTQQRERAGEAAHSDAVKAQLQLQQQRRSFQDATLAIENARLKLAVLLSPTLDENFTVVDDLDSTKILPPFPELKTMAEKENPSLKAADAAIRQASFDVRSARNALLPTLSIEGNYGIDANAFKLHSTRAGETELGVLPNLGYSVAFNLSIPIFDWGATKSKIRQAQTKQQQATLQLTQAQREIASNLYGFYNEAVAARGAVDLARSSADLAAESLRLINLRYQAGESTVLEVVDAQNTLIEARLAYDEAQVRYRVAVTSLQSVTGGF
jgi:outer membrane protein TolC